MKKSMNRDFPLSPTPAGSEVSSSGPITPPAKKYTPQDSANYVGMVKRYRADNVPFVSNPKEMASRDRNILRLDSMVNSPYFEAKAKVEVKNGVTTKTLKKNNYTLTKFEYPKK